MRLRVALVGAGLVGQAAHAQTLAEEQERFELVGIVDPSTAVAAAVAARYGATHAVATLADLVPHGLDAIVCAAPDPVHRDVAVEALGAGLHVLCEKPLALSVAECDAMIAAAAAAGRVLQCGYMKLHDPAFRALLDLLPGSADDVAYLSVEVNDPDQVPFVQHLPMVSGRDVPADLIAETRRRYATTVGAVAGREPTAADGKAFEGYLSSMVHDLSLVHAILDRLGHPVPAPIADAAFWDRGRAVSLGLDLEGGGRVQIVHVNLPGVPDYTERLTVFCRDRILELTFPSPYLRHHPTRLVERRGDGTAAGLLTTEHRVSYEEAFRDELRAFHAAVVDGTPITATAERARTDVAVLVDAFALAASRGS